VTVQNVGFNVYTGTCIVQQCAPPIWVKADSATITVLPTRRESHSALYSSMYRSAREVLSIV